MNLIALIAFIFVSSPFNTITAPSSQQLTAKVIGIADGDTYEALLPDKTTLKIRMQGIDAPEKGMPFYQVAKNYLSQLCFGRNVRIEKLSTDRYGRTIARTYLHGQEKEVGLMMIEAGLAWHFKKYSSDKELAAAEIGARKNKKGLWVDTDCIAPWDYRNAKKKATHH
jgi:micrococcal nuclease